MSDVQYSVDQVQKWTVEDVMSFVEDLGFANKQDVVNSREIDGPKLLASSVEDLKKAGFLGLQAKKIKSVLPEAKAPVVASAASATSANQNASPPLNPEAFASADEVLALRVQLQELKSQIVTLTRSAATTSPPASSQPAIPSNRVTVPGFCLGCVIEGHQTQTLTITMGPGDVVQADPGAMVHMSTYIELQTKTSNAMGRFFTGQGLFLTEFSYRGPAGTADTICFTPDFPGQIIPVDISHHGGHVICQKNSLLCSAPSIQVQVEFTQSLGAGFFGGEGFILQGLVGSGMAFLNARGSIIQMTLRANERRTVATGCLVAFVSTVRYTVRAMPGLANALFGGEGLFVTELVGPGTVWIESQDMSRLYRSLNSSVNKGR